MVMSLDKFILENEILLEDLYVKIINDKIYFVIDDGTLIEGNYNELIKFIN